MSSEDNKKIEKVTKEIGAMTPEMRAQVIMGMSVYAGPIPSAEQFEKYEKACPGSGDRILKMAEKQSAHRQSLEQKAIESDIENSKRGQIFAFVLALTIMLGGLALLLLNKKIEGLATLAGEAAILVSLFIYSKHSEKQERIEKFKK